MVLDRYGARHANSAYNRVHGLWVISSSFVIANDYFTPKALPFLIGTGIDPHLWINCGIIAMRIFSRPLHLLFALLVLIVSLTFINPSTQAQTLSSNEMSKKGPWLVFGTQPRNQADVPTTYYAQPWNVLWAIDPDGTAPVKLIDSQPDGSIVARLASAPNRNEIFYISVLIDNEHPNGYHPVLNLLTLPDGKHRVITKLTDSQSEPIPTPDASGYVDVDPRNEILEAILTQENLVWSPDGKYLAFIGAQDGPSSDLYVYSDVTGKVTRLTSGPAEVYRLSWSPDSKYIVHTGLLEFGTGAGHVLDKAWAAAADGSRVIDLYPLSDMRTVGDEEFIGWVDNTTFVAATWDMVCGFRNLRTFNILTKAEKTLYKGYISTAALGGGSTPSIIFGAQDCPMTDKPAPLPAGLYLMNLKDLTARKVAPNPDGLSVNWQAAQGMYYTNDFSQIAPDGTVSPIPEPPEAPDGFDHPVSISRDGNWSAWIDVDKNLYVSKGKDYNKDTQLTKIKTENVAVAFWMP